MSDSNFSAIRARLRYESIEEFISGYARFISAGGMFIPMAPAKLKPIGTTIRFQFLLADGSTALLGEGVVVQVRPPDEGNPKAPVGMLVKFSKLSQDAKNLVDQIVAMKDVGAVGLSIQEDEVEASEPEEDVAEVAEAPEEETPEEEEVPVAAADVHEQPTTEAPTAETTAEAPTEEDDEPEQGPGPKKLAQTEGGLQILAFDEISDEEAGAMDFDFGAEESDVDEMFEGLFGGGGDDGGLFGGGGGDDMFGGFGEAEEPATGQSSVEFELPDEEALAEESDVEAQDDEFAIEAEEPEDHFGVDEGADDDFGSEEESESEEEFGLDEESDEDELVADDPDDFGIEEESEEDFGIEEESEEDFGIDEESEEDFGIDEESEPEEDFGIEEESEEDFGIEEESEEDFGIEEESEEDFDIAEEADELDDEFGLDDESDQELVAEAEDEFESGLEEPSLGEPINDLSEPSEVELAAAALLADEEEEEHVEDGPGIQYDVVSSARDADEPESEEVLELDSEVELIEGSEAEELIIEADEEPNEAVALAEESGPSELENLLGHLEDEPDHSLEGLHFASDPTSEPEPPAAVEPEEEDEESLEFLLAAANKEIEEKRGDEPDDDGRDILDDLLGDEANLPPPPADAPSFPQPQQPQKKKGGFLSKLFGKD